MDHMFWTLASVSAFLVGASKGGLPMVGVLSVPVLALAISPVVAAGLLLPIYIVSDVYGLWIYRKSYDLRNIKIILPAATFGIGIGWATASITSDSLVKLVVGIVGLSYFANAFLRRGKVFAATPADVPRGMFWGTIAGFTSFVSHSGGPPYQMYVLPQKLDKMAYAGTATIIFAIINLLKVPPYWFLGQLNFDSLKTGMVLAPVAIFGAWAGYSATKAIPEKLFFRLVEAALLILSIKLIFDALHAIY